MTEWINHTGQDCPIDPDTIVDVRFHDGEVDTDFAGCWDWTGTMEDIAAYRVSKANSGPLLEAVESGDGWFKVTPVARSLEQLAEVVGEPTALMVAGCIRDHKVFESEVFEPDYMFLVVMRLIRRGDIEVRVFLDGSSPEISVSFAHVCSDCAGRVLH